MSTQTVIKIALGLIGGFLLGWYVVEPFLDYLI
jgi:hypothetical protein